MFDGDLGDGYIKLWRKSLHSPILKNRNLWTFWTWCLLKATHTPFTGLIGYQEIHLEPGQFLYGRRAASDELNFSERECRTCMKTLETLGNLTIKTTNHYSIVSICKWETYQFTDTKERPTERPTGDQQTTNERPASDQQVTTYKNGKNGKNGKNKDNYIPSPPIVGEGYRAGDDAIGKAVGEPVEPVVESKKKTPAKNTDPKKRHGEFVMLTDSERGKLVEKLGEQKTIGMIERLDNYIGSTGKKYASHYHTILNWIRMDADKNESRLQTETPRHPTKEHYDDGLPFPVDVE